MSIGTITLSPITNESQYSDIALAAKAAGCDLTTEDMMTKCIISGAPDKLAAFELEYYGEDAEPHTSMIGGGVGW